MRHLIIVMLVLGSVFASTFIIGRATGILTVENVQLWLEMVYEIEAAYVIAAVVLLLFADLFIAVPTLTIILLAGYFLGFGLGAMSALVGTCAAAFSGYAICRRWGERGISLIVKDEVKRQELRSSFQESGPFMILLSRAAPILPEVTACMAGATRMAPSRYGLFFALGNVPYIVIAAYAGSVSTIEDPRPAIYTALLLYATLWAGWYVYRRRHQRA